MNLFQHTGCKFFAQSETERKGEGRRSKEVNRDNLKNEKEKSARFRRTRPVHPKKKRGKKAKTTRMIPCLDHSQYNGYVGIA